MSERFTGTDGLPPVTVVMPVRNEERFIARSLGAVFGQDYPADAMEIIVADGMSEDGTRAIVTALQEGRPNLLLVDNPGRIAPTGLNAALAKARGDVIVRVDGHCEIAPDYVRRAVAHLSAGRADGVGGPLTTVGETRVAKVIARAMSSRFGVGGSGFRTNFTSTMPVDTVAFPAYARATIELGGPFDEELVRNQDDEYNYRLRRLGARILLASDVRCKYYSRSSLRTLAKQYFQYGYWKVRVMQKHPRQMRPRQFAPVIFVATLAVLLVSAPFSSVSAWALCGLLGLYALANLAATISIARESGTDRTAVLALLPLTFAILHLSYGSGFLVGLVRFYDRWRDRGVTGESSPARLWLGTWRQDV